LLRAHHANDDCLAVAGADSPGRQGAAREYERTSLLCDSCPEAVAESGVEHPLLRCIANPRKTGSLADAAIAPNSITRNLDLESIKSIDRLGSFCSEEGCLRTRWLQRPSCGVLARERHDLGHREFALGEDGEHGFADGTRRRSRRCEMRAI
jgi:hypothetical protein